MSVSKAQVEKACKDLGVEDVYVGPTGRGYIVEAYTPPDMMWVATGCHTLVVSVETITGSSEKCRAEALQDMKKGVEKCTQDDCDVCEGR